jgi:glycine cleavage system H protein
MAGEIVAVNSELEQHPERVNESPYDTGWLFKLKTSATGAPELMDSAAYQAFLDSQAH